MSEKIKQDIYSIRVSVLIALKQIYGVSYEEFFQGLPDSR